MTYLQLCQFVQRYIAAGNDLPGSGNPTTVVGQTGLYQEIVNWVADAYRDIQQEESGWLFRQGLGQFTLTNGISLYSKATIQAAIPTYERIHPYSNGDNKFISITSTVGDPYTNCYYVPFIKSSGVILDSIAAKPIYFTVQPDESLKFWPSQIVGPISQIAVFNYTKTIATLSADSDVPVWPSEWHDAIAWRAIRYWAMVRENPSKFQIADGELQRAMRALRATQLQDASPTIEPPTQDTP